MSVLTAVIMAGGRGRRAGDPEKCMWPLCGVPLLFRVAGALAQVAAKVVVLTTPAHRRVAKYAAEWGLEVVYTPGEGYEKDFLHAARLAPAVVAACDLANLSPGHVERLLAYETFATAVSQGGYPGLSYLPTPRLDRWADVDVGALFDVDTPEDLERAEEECPVAYPLYVPTSKLRPHEDVLEERPYQRVWPIAVDYKTGVILDGHHRFAFLKKLGVAPVLLFDYDVVDVNVDKRAVVEAAATGRLMPPKTTWHTYRRRHISQIPTVEVPVDYLTRRLSRDA